MQKVRLMGNISKFGNTWSTDCRNIRDIFKLIECQTTGFRQYLIEAAEAGVSYEIKRGNDYLEHADELLLSIGEEDIIITEIPAGAKSAGAKILGAILLTALFFIPGVGPLLMASGGGLTMFGSMVAGLAMNLAMQGLTQLMAPGPETEKKDEGYLFQGPENNVQAGMAIPIVYGELRVGGKPVSVNFSSRKGWNAGVGALESASLNGVTRTVNQGGTTYTYRHTASGFQWSVPIGSSSDFADVLNFPAQLGD